MRVIINISGAGSNEYDVDVLPQRGNAIDIDDFRLKDGRTVHAHGLVCNVIHHVRREGGTTATVICQCRLELPEGG